MFIQFFGGYLLSKGVVTPEQLVKAIEKEATSHIKLGTLAMHASLMTPIQIEEIKIAQTHTDKRFGELCVEKGYLTDEQVTQLLSEQYPKYLLLGQILTDEGVFDHETFQMLVNDYITESCIDKDGIPEEDNIMIHAMLTDYCRDIHSSNKEYLMEYLTLMVNNLIRFIGADFTLMPPVNNIDCHTAHYSTQKVTGPFKLDSVIDMDEDIAVMFASRYVNEMFESFDEYVQASMEDFLNLHNGLFTVNISNSYSVELQLEAPYSGTDLDIPASENVFVFQALYPFGTVNILITDQN